ncbi:ribosomal RNA-processing protein 14-C-like [Argonauta hians]
MAINLPNIVEDNDLFEHLYSLLPNGPKKTQLEPKPKSTKAKGPAVDAIEADDNAIELELKLQNKIESLQSKRKLLERGVVLERRKIKKQEKKLQKKKKSLAAKTENSGKRENKKVEKGPPQVNQDDKFLYSSLEVDGPQKKKRKTITGLHGKNYKQLLAKVERSEKKLKDLEAEDAEAADKMKSDAKMKAALDKAMGKKIKDDPQLLKKAMKRKEKLKMKRKKAWEEREQNMEKKKDAKQAKRNKNIQKRKDQVQTSKSKKSIKRGKVLPGML